MSSLTIDLGQTALIRTAILRPGRQSDLGYVNKAKCMDEPICGLLVVVNGFLATKRLFKIKSLSWFFIVFDCFLCGHGPDSRAMCSC